MTDEFIRYMEVARQLTDSTDIDDLIIAANKIARAAKSYHDLDYIANYVETGNIYGRMVDFADQIEIDHPVNGLTSFKLYPYQRDVLNTMQDNRYVVITHGRQLGITTLISIAALFEAVSKPDQTIVIMSHVFRGALDTMQRIQSMLKSSSINRTLLGHIPIAVTRATRDSLSLENGSRIIARAATPHATRGMSITHCFIDEASHVPHKQIADFWDSIYPCMAMGGRLVVSGAPGLPKGVLWDAVSGGRMAQTAVHLHLPATVHPDRDDAWLDEQRRLMGPVAFRNQVMAEFTQLEVDPL